MARFTEELGRRLSVILRIPDLDTSKPNVIALAALDRPTSLGDEKFRDAFISIMDSKTLKRLQSASNTNEIIKAAQDIDKWWFADFGKQIQDDFRATFRSLIIESRKSDYFLNSSKSSDQTKSTAPANMPITAVPAAWRTHSWSPVPNQKGAKADKAKQPKSTASRQENKPARLSLWFVLLICLVSGGMYASPYIALEFLKRAAKENNASVFLQSMDVRSVRNGIRRQVEEQIASSSQNADVYPALTDLVRAVSGKDSDNALARIISREGMSQLLETGSLPLTEKSFTDRTTLAKALNSSSLIYKSLNEVSIKLPTDSAHLIMSLELSRHSLVGWKTVDIELNLASPISDVVEPARPLSCSESIAEIEGEIIDTVDLPIYRHSRQAIDSPYPDRTSSYNFTIGSYDFYADPANSDKISSFLSDDELVANFSRRIIDSCPDIAKVSFGKLGTDYIVSMYYSPEGLIKENCVEGPLGMEFGWGEARCL